EDFSDRLRRKPGVARDCCHATNHSGLARRIENRETGFTLEHARPLADREAFGKESDELIVDALDLVATARELGDSGWRFAVGAHATALASLEMRPSVRPAAIA